MNSNGILRNQKIYVAILIALCCILSLPEVFQIKEQPTALENRRRGPRSKEQPLFVWPKKPSEDPTACENLLVQVLHDDPDRNAFRDLTLRPSENLECFFSGLDSELMDVYRHRRIAFLGDSTLRNLVKWLDALLQTEDLDDFPSLTLQEGKSRVEETASQVDIRLYRSTDAKPVIEGRMHIEFNGIGGVNNGNQEAKHLEEAWEKTRAIKPQVLVVNMGIHWLHLIGHGKDCASSQIIHWMEYNKWLQQCVDKAIEYSIGVLVFKKTNIICENVFYGEFEQGSNLYRQSDPTTLEMCHQNVSASLQEANFVPATNDLIAQYCSKGTMSQIGSQYLNEQTVQFVENLPTIPGLEVTIFDDSSVQSCTYTHDGRHFYSMNALRLRLLANQLQSILDGRQDKDN